ncbi:hypothetical protein ANN_17967 [Periplaneta americana]|uniref:Uncharacterized protein n=1 Tax=Periplaneta americana TaxID=6978 RepID=A0ABQ8SMF8_PERAM|nr:hypothetical protein ANN_17967 [Periplaneta americana]
MAGLCEGGNEPPGSLKASKYRKTLTEVDGRHLLGDVLVDEGDPQGVERGCPGAMQELSDQEQPHVVREVVVSLLVVAAVSLLRN